jgi:putative ABC transport system ATP-binding protein
MPSLIELEDVSRVYSMGDVDVHALRNVSLHVQAGEFIAIMGASGSGKSTLMNIVGCLDRPTAGRYTLEGTDVSTRSRTELALTRNRTLGFVFQSFNLLARTSAEENVELPLLYAGVGTTERRRRSREALELVGLGNRMDHVPSQLSGGQQQRVAIARSLVNRPRVLLADEPTGALDSQTSFEIMALLQELGQTGICIVLVTHEHDIAAFARRLIIMRDGKITSDVSQTPTSHPSPANEEH